MKGERGFALVITLIVTMLLTGLVVEFINETYVDASHSHNFVASQQAAVLSESGAAIGRGLLEMELSGHAAYSSLLDMWAQPLTWEDDTGKVAVTISEESGKLNLNNVLFSGADKDYPYRNVALNLFQKLKLPPELVSAAVDWVNAPDQPPQTNGARSSYYNTLKPPYDAKGAKLDTVEELGLVKGFSPEILAKLKPYITVYPSMENEPLTQININTAPPELLLAIPGVSADLVSRILDTRKTKPIKTLSDIEGLGSPSPALLQMLNFRGRVYRIHSEGKVGDSVSVTEAVVRVSDASSQILYWREY